MGQAVGSCNGWTHVTNNDGEPDCTVPLDEKGDQKQEVGKKTFDVIDAVPEPAPDVAGLAAQAETEAAKAESSTAAPAAAPATYGEEGFQDRRFNELKHVYSLPPDYPGKHARRPSTVGVSLNDYVAKHAADYESVLEMEPMDGWTLKNEQDEVKIYVRADASGIFGFKAICDMKVNEGGLTRLLGAILNVEKRPVWDAMCLEGRALQTFVPFYRYTLVRMSSPAPYIIANRELCILGRVRFEQDGGAVVFMTSTEHPDAPEGEGGYVRARMVKGGYIIRPKNGSSSEFTVKWLGLVDPKGWLPQWVGNAAAWKQGLTLARFKANALNA